MTGKAWPGVSYPLGATYDGVGTNFALYTEAADQVELCLFDAAGPAESGPGNGSPSRRSTATSGTAT